MIGNTRVCLQDHSAGALHCHLEERSYHLVIPKNVPSPHKIEYDLASIPLSYGIPLEYLVSGLLLSLNLLWSRSNLLVCILFQP